MSNWSSFKDGIEYEDIRKFFLNKCKELGLKSKYRNGEITFEDVDSYDYFMGDFSDDGVLSIYYPFTLKKEYFMSNFEDYDEFLAQFMDIYDSAMIEKRLRKTESKKFAKKSITEKELKMDVWEWGDVKGTDEELCNHIAEYAEEKGIEYMEITEDEFEYLKKDYLKKYKSMKESVKPEIQLMVNNIIDELIGEYSSKEWDALSANEKFDIVRTEYFLFNYKSKYLSEVRDLVIENMNHPFNVVFESKKSAKKSLKEENNRQKVTEGIMNYFKDVFPLIEKHDAFRFSMYTKKDIKIGVELFKDYINVLLFNLDGKGNLDEYIEIPRETYGTIEDEILYDSDAIWGYLEQYELVK